MFYYYKMHVLFDPNNIDWSSHQWGEGSVGGSVFHGMPYQRGSGLGSIFKHILRFLSPVGREAGKLLSEEGLKTGSEILKGLIEGKNFTDVARRESKRGIKNVFARASEKLSSQEGEGIKRIRKRTQLNKKGIYKGKIGELKANVGPPAITIKDKIKPRDFIDSY